MLEKSIFIIESSNTWPSVGSTLLGKILKKILVIRILSGDGTRVAVGAPYPTEFHYAYWNVTQV